MSLKAEYIAALRAVPDGLNAFLETPLPAPPTGLIQPTTEAEANIMTGILSYYLLQVFATFTDLTPVELALRIGQHSSPMEAMCLAGLEYLEQSDKQLAFTIIVPQDGNTYAPGEVKIAIQPTNGKIAFAEAAVSAPDQTSVTVRLDSESEANDYYAGYVRCDLAGNYTLNISVTFRDADKTVKTASLTVTIADTEAPPDPQAETPLPPGGTDAAAVKKATAAGAEDLKQLASAVASELPDDAAAALAALNNTLAAIAAIVASAALPESAKSLAAGAAATAQAAVAAAAAAVSAGAETAFETAKTAASTAANAINTLKTLLEDV